jgi:hypothetical protein
MVLQYLGCLVKGKIILKFLLASFKKLTNTKDCSESPDVHIMPGFRNNFQDHWRLSEQRTELQAAILQLEQASRRK